MENKACETCPFPKKTGVTARPSCCIWDMEGDDAGDVRDGCYLDADYLTRDGTLIRFLEMDLAMESCRGYPVEGECFEAWSSNVTNFSESEISHINVTNSSEPERCPRRKIYVVQEFRPTVQYTYVGEKCVSNCNMYVMHCVQSREQAMAKIDRLARKGEWRKADGQ